MNIANKLTFTMPQDRGRKAFPMKKPLFSPPAVLILALALAGCFGGEDEGATNPGTTDTAGAARKTLVPGLYAGDYSPYDTTRTLESEITLAPDGSFRFYWVISNEIIGDQRGKWFQRDSSLFFNSANEAFLQSSGRFNAGQPIEDDTNSVRNLTDTSFIRKEYTLIRQKPFWITYRKKAVGAVKGGDYAYVKAAADTGKVDIKLTLSGTGFLYSYADTSTSFQVDAQWYQFGSVFGTEQHRERTFIDSTKAFGEWAGFPGTILQRVRNVSDAGFEMWNAQSAAWETYRKPQ